MEEASKAIKRLFLIFLAVVSGSALLPWGLKKVFQVEYEAPKFLIPAIVLLLYIAFSKKNS